MKTNKIHNVRLASSVQRMEEASETLSAELHDLESLTFSKERHVDNLQARLAALSNQNGISLPLPSAVELVEEKKIEKSEPTDKNDETFRLDNLSDIDVVLSCVAGGIGVLVDFLVVRIPKSTTVVRNGKRIHQSGSPLTEWMRKIGFNEDGKTSKWVEIFEKNFGVNYDTSKLKGEKGFTPKSHRIYSLAHDPSPSGFLWAIKDMVCGTFSYIDRDGKLKIIPAKSNSIFKILATPVVWLGHLISDIFTKAGIPLPGSCFLRTLQFGSFGEKKRTIGQVIEYMYLEGYDLRHFATMSIVNACVELIIRLYNILTKPQIAHFARPSAMIQADKEMLKHKLRKMRLCGYAVAATGNIVKLKAYLWNPTALNVPVWLELTRVSLAELKYQNSSTEDVIEVMEYRHNLEQNFKRIERRLSEL